MGRKTILRSMIISTLLFMAGLQGMTPDLTDLRIRLLEIIRPQFPQQHSSPIDDATGELCGLLLSESSLTIKKLTQGLVLSRSAVSGPELATSTGVTARSSHTLRAITARPMALSALSSTSLAETRRTDDDLAPAGDRACLSELPSSHPFEDRSRIPSYESPHNQRQVCAASPPGDSWADDACECRTSACLIRGAKASA